MWCMSKRGRILPQAHWWWCQAPLPNSISYRCSWTGPMIQSNKKLFHGTVLSMKKLFDRTLGSMVPSRNKLFEGTLGCKVPSNNKLFDGTVPSTKQLFDGTHGEKVPSNNKLFDGTVPSTKQLFDGTVPSTKQLFDGTVPSNSFSLSSVTKFQLQFNFTLCFNFTFNLISLLSFKRW